MSHLILLFCLLTLIIFIYSFYEYGDYIIYKFFLLLPLSILIFICVSVIFLNLIDLKIIKFNPNNLNENVLIIKKYNDKFRDIFNEKFGINDEKK